MEKVIEVGLTGLRWSLRGRLLLPLYVTGLLLGALQSWPLLLAGRQLTNPQLGAVAEGGFDALVNLLLGSRAALEQAGLSAGLWLAISLLLLPLYGLAYNFFAGGILNSWAGTRAFWTGCRHHFWSFVGLSLLLLLAAGLVGLGTLGLALLLGWPALLIGLGLLGLLNVGGELARGLAVAQAEGNPLKLLGLAFGFGVRHWGGVLLLAGLGLALPLLVSLVYGAGSPFVSGSLAAVLVQQVTVLLWVWLKLLRLAWALGYVRGATV